MSIPRLMLGLAVLAICPLAPLEAAAQQVAGRWLATEFDPFIPENAFFGQYRYAMDIIESEDGYQIHISRTGAVLSADPLDGDRLTAAGKDPNRGSLELSVRLQANGFEGKLMVGGREKRIVATRDPNDQLAKTAAVVGTAQADAAAARERAARLRQGVDGLRDRIAELEQALARSRTARQRGEQELGDLRKQLQAAQSRPAPTALTRRNAAAAPGTTKPAAAASLTIDVIEPGAVREGARIATAGTATREIVGRISGPVPLFSANINGAPLAIENNGLFRTKVALQDAQTAIRIVAVDHDGRRAALNFTLARTDTGPTASQAPAATPDESARMRCYRLAIAASAPGEDAIDVCRQAMEAEGAEAIDHYHLAVALSRLGRHSEALAAYRDAAARWSR